MFKTIVKRQADDDLKVLNGKDYKIYINILKCPHNKFKNKLTNIVPICDI